MRILSKRSIYFVVLAILGLGVLLIAYSRSKIESASSTYEIADYLKKVTANNEVELLCEKLCSDNEQITIVSQDGEVEIILQDVEGIEDSLWTLCGLQPGMSLEDVYELLNVPEIVMEQHNMQWYATGIELEKRGIRRLSWDPNNQITYVSAIIDTEKIKVLQGYKFSVLEKEYTFIDEERNVDIVIKYPLVEMENHVHIAENINKSIEDAVDRLRQDIDLSSATKVTINADYTIQNAESECFSVLWTGKYCDEEKVTEIGTAITCSILDEGRLLALTDMGWTEEQLAREVAWREELDESILIEQFSDNYFDYYVTPLHLVVSWNNPKTEESVVTEVWR